MGSTGSSKRICRYKDHPTFRPEHFRDVTTAIDAVTWQRFQDESERTGAPSSPSAPWR